LAIEANEMFDGKIEIDASYFGRQRKGKVYTVIVNDTKTQTLMPLISRKVKPDSVV